MISAQKFWTGMMKPSALCGGIIADCARVGSERSSSTSASDGQWETVINDRS